MGVADDMAVYMRLLPWDVSQQLYPNDIRVLSLGETARGFRTAHGQQGCARRIDRANDWIRKRLHGQFRSMHSRAKRNDNVLRFSLGHRIRCNVNETQEDRPNIINNLFLCLLVKM